jgi:hypothetical protein
MKTWYRAVCNEHKEMCNVIVSNPECSMVLLGKHSKEIENWFSKHYSCNLRLIHNDYDLEKVCDYKDELR